MNIKLPHDVTRKDFAWLHVAAPKMTQFSVSSDPTWKTTRETKPNSDIPLTGHAPIMLQLRGGGNQLTRNKQWCTHVWSHTVVSLCARCTVVCTVHSWVLVSTVDPVHDPTRTPGQGVGRCRGASIVVAYCSTTLFLAL